jgi:arylsulfatase A-like enzyme
MSQQLNFLCIVADQLRFDALGCCGHPAARTPHLDRLAGQGTRLDRCYTVQPMCMATRSTWLTGLNPRGHRVRCNGIPLDPRLPTMTGALAEAGYRTHSIGKIHANPWLPHRALDAGTLDPAQWPEAIALWDAGRLDQVPLPYYGFQGVDLLTGWWSGHYGRWLAEREPRFRELVAPPPGVAVTPQGVLAVPETTYPCRLPAGLHYTHWATACAERFLDSARAGAPFFLWCSIPDPHPPFSVSEPWYSLYEGAGMPEPARREGELDDLPPHYKRLFEQDMLTAGRAARTAVPRAAELQAQRVVCGIVSQWDAMVGRLLDLLEARGLMDNTVVVVMSDHGQMLGDHWMHNMPPTHLDGVARVPAIWSGPGIDAGRVRSGLASHLDFAPTILDLAGVPIPEGRVPPEPEAPAQRPAWPGRSLAPMLRGETVAVQDAVIIENDEDYLGMRQRTLVTPDHHLTCYAGEDYGELYDLRDDPRQLVNRWGDAAYRECRRDLQAALLYRLMETDPVLPRRMGHA